MTKKLFNKILVFIQIVNIIFMLIKYTLHKNYPNRYSQKIIPQKDHIKEYILLTLTEPIKIIFSKIPVFY